MNPCPCGMFGGERNACRCSAKEVERYRARVSRPILDRIDLHLSVPAVDPALSLEQTAQSSRELREAVCRAAERLGGYPPVMERTEDAVLIRAASSLHLSMRALDRTRRICRSIAALDGTDRVSKAHVAEALRYRESGH